jgi:hypothetical protein
MIHHGSLLISSTASSSSSSSSSKRQSRSPASNHQVIHTCFDFQQDVLAVGTSIGSVLLSHLICHSNRLVLKKQLELLPPPHDRLLESSITCIRLSGDNNKVAIGNAKGCVIVFDISNGSSGIMLYKHCEHISQITAMAWSLNAYPLKLFSGCMGGKIVELNMDQIPSPDSLVSTLTIASFFVSPTKTVSKASYAISQIECSSMETLECGLTDLVLVSAGPLSVLYQYPLNPDIMPFKQDLEPTNPPRRRVSTNTNADTWGASPSLAGGCFSNSTMYDVSSNTRISRSNGIWLCRSGKKAPQLVYCDNDGATRKVFELTVVGDRDLGQVSHGDAEANDILSWGCKSLHAFHHDAYKHLLLCSSDTDKLAVINMTTMTIHQFPLLRNVEILRAVAWEGRIIALCYSRPQELIFVDLFECLGPAAIKLPLQVFNSTVHAAICALQRSYRGGERGTWQDKVLVGNRKKGKSGQSSPSSPSSSSLSPLGRSSESSYDFLSEDSLLGSIIALAQQLLGGKRRMGEGLPTPTRHVSNPAIFFAHRYNRELQEEAELHALSRCDEIEWMVVDALERADLETEHSIFDADDAIVTFDQYLTSRGSHRSLDDIVTNGATVTSNGQGVVTSLSDQMIGTLHELKASISRNTADDSEAQRQTEKWRIKLLTTIASDNAFDQQSIFVQNARGEGASEAVVGAADDVLALSRSILHGYGGDDASAASLWGPPTSTVQSLSPFVIAGNGSLDDPLLLTVQALIDSTRAVVARYNEERSHSLSRDGSDLGCHHEKAMYCDRDTNTNTIALHGESTYGDVDIDGYGYVYGHGARDGLDRSDDFDGDDPQASWLKDTDGVWLEGWWASGVHPVVADMVSDGPVFGDAVAEDAAGVIEPAEAVARTLDPRRSTVKDRISLARMSHVVLKATNASTTSTNPLNDTQHSYAFSSSIPIGAKQWQSDLAGCVGPHRRVVHTDIPTVESLDQLDLASYPYTFSVNMLAPIGISFNLVPMWIGSLGGHRLHHKRSALQVRAFNRIVTGTGGSMHHGPAELSGLISIGDYLLQVNGIDLLGLDLTQIEEIFSQVSSSKEVRFGLYLYLYRVPVILIYAHSNLITSY